MSITEIVKQSGAVVRPLSVLVPLIREDLQNAEKAGMPYYREAGAKILEAKGQLAHGDFVSWIKRHFKIGERQAQFYMNLAAAAATGGKQNRIAMEAPSIRRFVQDSGTLSHGKPASWHEPVREIIDKAKVNAARLAQENLNRAEEREAQRKLALQLIDIGYKALASKLHPDKMGGSRDAMARLNTVRARLKGCA